MLPFWFLVLRCSCQIEKDLQGNISSLLIHVEVHEVV